MKTTMKRKERKRWMPSCFRVHPCRPHNEDSLTHKPPVTAGRGRGTWTYRSGNCTYPPLMPLPCWRLECRVLYPISGP